MATSTAKQATYVWEGADKRANRINGEMRATSIALVKADLRRRGISPLKVKKKSGSLFTGGTKPVRAKDIALFSRQLATMMSSGVPLVQSFEIIGKGSDHSGMQALVASVKLDIEGGSSLAQALGKHPRQFDELFCNLVAAGEQAGILENLLNKIAVYKEKTEAIKGKIKKAMFYPTAVLVVAFIITAILMLFVVPQFEAMFSSFGGELPAATQFVVSLSEIFQAWWWAIFGGVAGSIFIILRLKQTSKVFNEIFDRVLLQIPVLGDIVRKATIARYARTLSTMFAAGVPLVEAMVSVAGAAGNSVYSNAILKMRDEVATGQQLQNAMQQAKIFPSMAVQMVAIGEESGALDNMLGKVADFYEQEVDDAVDGLSSLMEPIIMVVLGVLIGGMVIAMYLPIFKMGQVI